MWVRAMQAAFCLKATSPCNLLSGALIFLLKTLSHCSIIPHTFPISHSDHHTPKHPKHVFLREVLIYSSKGMLKTWGITGSQKKKKNCVKWLSIPIKWITILVYRHHFTSEKERNKRGWGGVRKLSGEETEVNTAGKCLGLRCSPHWAGVSWAGSLDRSQKWQSIYSEWKLTVCSEHIV